MDFQITLHSISGRLPEFRTSPWFAKLRSSTGYKHKTKALNGELLEYRERFDIDWEDLMILEVSLLKIHS